jgi:hypothetical protein
MLEKLLVFSVAIDSDGYSAEWTILYLIIVANLSVVTSYVHLCCFMTEGGKGLYCAITPRNIPV